MLVNFVIGWRALVRDEELVGGQLLLHVLRSPTRLATRVQSAGEVTFYLISARVVRKRVVGLGCVVRGEEHKLQTKGSGKLINVRGGKCVKHVLGYVPPVIS